MKEVLNFTSLSILLLAVSCKATHSTYARAVYDSQLVDADSEHSGHAVLINHYTQRKARCYILKKITTEDGTFIFVDSKSAKQLGINFTNSAPVEVVSMTVQQ